MQPFAIALNGLAQGGTRFNWHADGKFFGNFDNSEILDSDLSVGVHVEKAARFLGVDCVIEGTVKVVCDRCLEDLTLPVATGFRLSVKFGEEAAAGTPGGGYERSDADDREIVMIPAGESELDLSQFIYDYVCTSLPMRRVHPDGECNPEAVRYLKDENSAGEEAPASTESPFAALKDILK